MDREGLVRFRPRWFKNFNMVPLMQSHALTPLLGLKNKTKKVTTSHSSVCSEVQDRHYPFFFAVIEIVNYWADAGEGYKACIFWGHLNRNLMP